MPPPDSWRAPQAHHNPGPPPSKTRRHQSNRSPQSRGSATIGSIELIRSTRTRTRVEACERLGFQYWAEHQGRNCVWATGGDRQFHVVQLPNKCSPEPTHVAGICCTDICAVHEITHCTICPPHQNWSHAI